MHAFPSLQRRWPHAAHILELAGRGAERVLENAPWRSAMHLRHSRLRRALPLLEWETWRGQRRGFVSKNVEELLGYGRREWLSGHDFWLEVMHPDDRSGVLAGLDAALASRQPSWSEFRWLARDGRTLWIDAHYIADRKRDGTLLCVRGVGLDITLRKAAELRLRKENEDRERFATILSHELRTSLQAILGWATLLYDRAGADEELQHGLTVIIRNARQQARLIEEVYEFSRGSAGKLTLERRAVAVQRLAQAAADTLRPAADMKMPPIAGWGSGWPSFGRSSTSTVGKSRQRARDAAAVRVFA